MKLTRRDFALAIGAPIALATSACAFLKPNPSTPTQPTTILSLIQNVISQAENALSTVGTYVNLSPQTVQTISAYLTGVGSAISGVIAALESGSVLTKVDNVIQVLASLASAPILSGVIPAPIGIIIAGVAAAIDAFIKFLPAAPSPLPTAHKVVLPNAQKRSLSTLQTRANAIVSNAKVLLIKHA